MTDPRLMPDPLFLSFQDALSGRYSIDRELGRGGMGVVYLAREVHLDRLVAIKLLPPELSVRPALRDRFLREAQVAAGLSHPNIIPIHAVEERDGFVYFVMAFVNGETLAQRVQSRGPLSSTDGTRLLREVAWALGYAHGQGLVHRDVKPDNILIEAATGRALVADFGIAAATGDALGEGVTGTPEFMSPEQAVGAETDARSDLYSLGATAFYALSGRLPFEGRTAAETLARQVSAPAPPLASVGLVVPRKLAALVDRCLAREPSLRPSSAQALADELGLAIEQRRELPVALRAFVKRNGRMDGGGTVLSLSGALVASVVTASFTSMTAGVAVLAAGVAATPVVFGVISARRLLGHGFTREDLVPAFRAEQESSREERSVQQRPRFSWRSMAERTMRKISAVFAASGAVLVPFALARNDPAQHGGAERVLYVLAGPLGSLILGAFAISVLAAFGWVVFMQLRKDVDVEFWTAVWTGQGGKLAFAAARRLHGSQPLTRAMTHRATELSLGLAAEQLFESLPRASRESLAELPALLQRLQADAHALRARSEVLQDALAGSVATEHDSRYESVRDERDLVRERMREIIGALETMRLGLLRLHAGSLTLDALTTQYEMASNVSANVERLLAAQREVEEVLRFPGHVELTPV